MLKAVLLDVDGTLFDTERLFMDGWLRASREFGYPMTYEQILFFHGKGQKENEASFLEWFGENADYWAVRALRQKYVEEMIAKDGVPLKPGLFEFLNFLKQQNIKIALATGTIRKEGLPRWEKSGLLPYIDASVCGDEVSHNKPDPEIFLKAAEKLSVAPEDCLVFEDSQAGLLAGHRAGCKVCLIPDMEEASEDIRKEAVDYVCSSLLEAIDLIRNEFIS